MSAPTCLTIKKSAYDAMLRHFAEESPRQACGLMSGFAAQVFHFYAIGNLNIRRDHLILDPLQVSRTEVSIYRRYQRVVGFCYSSGEKGLKDPWFLGGRHLPVDQSMNYLLNKPQVVCLIGCEPSCVEGYVLVDGMETQSIQLKVVENLDSFWE